MKNIITGIVLFVMTSSAYAVEHLRLSTTTSTDNSGLLSVLHPAFEAKYNAMIDVIAVGTGKALTIGSHGDVDVVFVHAPAAELKYIEQGDFIDRTMVMHNDFVIIGPENDPADINSATSATQALQRIANTNSEFISRGDDSGTHKKEKFLWTRANIKPQGDWYLNIGQSMGAVLNMADQKQAYTLTDRGTLIAYADKINMQLLFQGDEVLFNPYHVIAVNPAKHSHVNYDLATKYIDFVTGDEGQTIINEYRLSNQQLFYGDAAKK
ncbi:MAG: substrate-binding domain-containing protein [Methylophagaceae bacterium]